MDLTRADLENAAHDGLLTAAQVDPLWEALSTRAATRSENGAPPSRFDLVHVAYYFGALLVIGAMGFFMSLGWESFGGSGLCAIASTYIVVFVLVGSSLWRRPLAEGTRTAGGLLFTMAVCIVPLGVYGLERASGLWPTTDPGTYRDFHVYVQSGWLWMELATVLAGLVALRSIRFPFLVAPIAFVLWYLSMDLAPILVVRAWDWNDRAWVSVAVGAVILVAAFIVDRRTREDFAFWLYFFGMLAFWGGLSSLDSNSELGRLGYLVVNLVLLVVSTWLRRRVLAVFGGLGAFGYLSYESWHTFRDSVAFPFVLSGVGLLCLFGTVRLAKRRAEIERHLGAFRPGWLGRFSTPPADVGAGVRSARNVGDVSR